MGSLILIFSPVIGGLIEGAFRKVNARMQTRIGPPVTQPFYDLFKLLQKRPLLINNYHVLMAFVHLVLMAAALATFLLGGDLLLVIFFHGMSLAFLAVGAYSLRSIYSQVGATRELFHILAVEPPLLLISVGIYMNTGSFLLSHVSETLYLVKTMPLSFLALLVTLPGMVRRSPFDVSDAHQEIIGGLEIEYSGPFYAPVYLAKWLEKVMVAAFIGIFFLGSKSLIGAAIIVSFILLLGVDNSTARLSYWDMVRLTWMLALPLAGVNIFLNALGVL